MINGEKNKRLLTLKRRDTLF